ncbi:MAG TPA: CBS domain-containing protein [Thermodesulfobacteriota bacterium]|nr:CBS domain-containing protein [Thermodesulfobacteriota bacterium]
MLKAKDIMTRKVITVFPETKINQTGKLLLENHFNGLPVVDQEGRLKGIICQDDLILQQKKFPLPSVFTLLDGIIPLTSSKHLEKEIQKMAATTVGQAMTPDPITVDPETTVEEIATLMVKKNIHTLPVVDKGKLVGVIGNEDILRTLMSQSE